MPKKQKAVAPLTTMRDKFLNRVAEMWDKHQHDFEEMLDEAESKKINVTFRAHIDTSESTAILETTCGFSQVVKDKVSDSFEDPNQASMEGITKEAEEQGKTRRGRKSREAAVAADTAEQASD